ncbi:hypothetical protein ASE14_00980 [Agromyces sp. Root81]|uniref:hypothetical protein n=1 Tax=Agromyces sp. Root81 TaxID=1736601 RepID=UPI0006FC62A1|nr:hypothetical protein [Agromyces sp. Root81]KRC62443.1 hypothetical protein ASE14_00980 [Agromyces sp. Root81]
MLLLVVAFAAAMGAVTWWLNAIGILSAAPVVGIFAVVYAVLAAVSFVWFAVDLSRRAKLAAFAWGNRWTFADTLDGARRTGSAFTRAVRSRERGVVACDDPRMPFELGRHFSIASGREAATIQRPFAFMELPLPASVPHIVLKNRRRSIVPTLGLGRGAARLALEGDFARTFTLIVPEGYERDALYIFTPDLMARVVDLGSGTEIELVGRQLYIYLPYGTRFDRPQTMSAALVVAEEFHRRFARRTHRYRDDAAGALAAKSGVSVGLRGQRLAGRGLSLLAVAVTASMVLLSCGVIVATLFGGDLLRSLGVAR